MKGRTQPRYIDWEGIYAVKRDDVRGYLKILDWGDWFHHEGDIEPDGSWLLEYRIGESHGIDRFGYRYGEDMRELVKRHAGIIVNERVATMGAERYRGLSKWIRDGTSQH